MKEFLAQVASGRVEVGHSGNIGQPELAIGRNHEMHRTFDLGSIGWRTVEVAREKNRRQQRRDFVVMRSQDRPELPHQFRRGILPDKIAIYLGRNKAGRHVLFQNNINNIDATVIPGMSEEGFLPVVVQLGFDDKVQPYMGPAGKRPGGFANVGLNVVAHTQGKEFQDFSAKVLVGVAFDILPRVQIDEHGRILGDADEEVTKTPIPPLPE